MTETQERVSQGDATLDSGTVALALLKAARISGAEKGGAEEEKLGVVRTYGRASPS